MDRDYVSFLPRRQRGPVPSRVRGLAFKLPFTVFQASTVKKMVPVPRSRPQTAVLFLSLILSLSSTSFAAWRVTRLDLRNSTGSIRSTWNNFKKESPSLKSHGLFDDRFRDRYVKAGCTRKRRSASGVKEEITHEINTADVRELLLTATNEFEIDA